MFLKKELCLVQWSFFKQYFFLLNCLLQSCIQSTTVLFCKTATNLKNAEFSNFMLEEKIVNFMYNSTLQVYFKEPKTYNFERSKKAINVRFFKVLQKSLILMGFLAITAKLRNKQLLILSKKNISLLVEGLTKKQCF